MMYRIFLTLGLLGLVAGCGSTTDARPSSAPTKPKTFYVTGTLHVDQVMNVQIEDGSCTVDGMDSPYVVVTNPAGKLVSKTALGTGKAQALPGAKYYTPGICEFPFELTSLRKDDGVFEVHLDGVDDASATFTDTDKTVQIDWS